LNTEISLEEFGLLLKDKKVLAVDVRERDEYRHERIAGVMNVPLSGMNQFFDKLPKDKEISVICKAGFRSPKAVQILKEAGYPHVCSVSGGLDAWKKKGWPIEKSGGPIPLQAQLRAVAGSLVVLGFFIPGGRWLSLFVGVGLLISGITGFCPMATLLAKMPWNRES